jgi:hypothetical protein
LLQRFFSLGTFEIRLQKSQIYDSYTFCYSWSITRSIFPLSADASSETSAKTKTHSFLSHIFFVWFDLFILKGKEGSLKGTLDFSPDSENRLMIKIMGQVEDYDKVRAIMIGLLAV